MLDPKHAVLPGIVAASVILVFLTRAISGAEPVAAATQQPVAASPQTADLAADEGRQECALPETVMPAVRAWCPQIEAAAAAYDLDPALIAAVMTQESGGQAEVISASGAVGLMQVMPSDGAAAAFQCVNGPCFARRPSTSELLDPAFNVDYGARMLAGLIGKFGSVRDALRAYGPYNIGYGYADKVLAIRSRF